MTQTQSGWIIGIAALGMMCGLLAVDVSQFMTWSEALKPAFIGSAMGHLAVVGGAFLGGKLVPQGEAWDGATERRGGTPRNNVSASPSSQPPTT
jgi:hypothetical protein